MVTDLILSIVSQEVDHLTRQTPFTRAILGTKLKWPSAPSVIFLISIRVNTIVIPRPLLPPLQHLSERIKRHLPHLTLIKLLIRLSNPRLLQIRQILKKRF
jgi:hypothetical protein